MKNQNIFLLLITALIVYLSRGMTVAFAQDAKEHIRRNFNIKPGNRLTIDSEIGTIDVRTADKSEIEVVVTKEAKGKLDNKTQKAFADFEITFKRNSSNVRVEGKFKRDPQYWMEKGHPLRVHFQVAVPYRFDVVLKTGSIGDIHVGDLDGNVKAESDVGNLNFGEIRGTVWGKTGGPGDITLKACQSDVDVESGIGHIKLGSVTGRVTAKTGGPGDVTLEQCQSDVDIESDVGHMRLGSVSGKVVAKTGGPGNITLGACQSDVDVESDVGHIKLGAIAGKVDAKTGGPGDVTLEQCQSDVDVESDVGHIRLDSVSGKVNAKTGGPGNITLGACQNSVEVESDIGNIDAEIPTRPLHPWILRTSGPGKIRVTLSPDAALNIDAETHGRISSDIPFQAQGPLTGPKLKGTINGGGPLLKLRTSIGEIRLKKKDLKRELGRKSL